ncbi:MAG: DNA polymerase III subunit gamma/tau [Flavobacteriaceae bacterium]|nr:DNA polymerase III subunit gamma/tau [Flavobacteriaceae bacterium]
MKNFVVSALKYRPKNFEDVVGQSTVTKTLENAIKLNQVPQAMLFCGPRGVGKTTCARILAKKINLESNQNNSFSYNIFELDAASNNGVDDIRNLIEQVRIPPQVGNHKVYIIDEVHMLSGQAFNAFLKTLEEPPAYAIFILATTEKHKVIPTILSRCQIFDFKKINFNDIKKFLEKISKKEKIRFETEALSLIAKKSDGALRDALSIFDRLVNYTEGNISRDLTYKNLNEVSHEVHFEMVNVITSGDVNKALILLDKVIKTGNSEYNFIQGFSYHLRDLLVAKNLNSEILLEHDEYLKNKYKEQCQTLRLELIVDAIEICDDCNNKYKSSKNQRLLVEICLMKLCSLFELKKKINDSEKHLKNKEQPSLKIEETIEKIEVKKNNNKGNLNLSTKIISGLSLSSLHEKKKIENEILLSSKNEINKSSNKEFSQDELSKYWILFANEIEKNGEKNLSSILQISEPFIKNINEIHYTVSNNINKTELEKNKHKIISFLSKKLKNDFLKIKVFVNKLEEKKFIYSSKEKFDKMKEINPIIEKMRKEFKLGL